MRSGRAIAVVVWAVLCGPIVLVLLRLPGAAWSALVFYHAGCLVAVWLAGGTGRSVRLGLPAALGLGALSAAVVLGAGALAWEWRLLPQGEVAAWSRWGVRPPLDRIWLVVYVLVNPWVEERYWRGALLSEPVQARFGRAATRALAILGFGIHHAVVLGASLGWGRGLVLVLPVVAAGAIWTVMRERSGGIAPAIASHRGADLALALLYLWRWRG